MNESAVISIAIAEDQALFRDCLVSRLNDSQDMVIAYEVTNGRELLEKIDRNNLPDIVLMDLNMPEMNGMETTRRLRADFPDLKIIILSVYSEPHYIAAMVEQGVNGYIAKNALFSEVREAIRNVNRHGFYFSQDVLKAMQAGMVYKKQKAITLDKLEGLTLREKEIIQLICQEFTAAEIADKLFISKRTAEGHRNNLLLKTGCRNTAGLVIFAIRNQLFNAEAMDI